MTLLDKLTRPGPKKILAIDGGGIRGALALEILGGIETILREASGRPDLRLSDYFDLVAGTSTGAIVAAGIAIGLEVKDILALYAEDGPDIFDRAGLLQRLTRYKYDDDKLSARLKDIFGENTTLGDRRLQTLLMMVMRNATTDSPWPVSNNPYAKYNEAARPNCNLHLPLWRLVRASTAAPAFFPPEAVEIGGHPFLFVDGGVTTYNNPAFLAFLMATVERYWVNRGIEGLPAAPSWPAATGPDKLMVVSIGCGAAADAEANLSAGEMHYGYTIAKVHSMVMYAALIEQDLLCRVFGDCLAGDPLDRELLDLIGPSGRGPVDPKLFTYVRYTADLSRDGLDRLGCGAIDPRRVNSLDAVDAVDELRAIGRAVAARTVRPEHFARFPPEGARTA